MESADAHVRARDALSRSSAQSEQPGVLDRSGDAPELAVFAAHGQAHTLQVQRRRQRAIVCSGDADPISRLRPELQIRWLAPDAYGGVRYDSRCDACAGGGGIVVQLLPGKRS